MTDEQIQAVRADVAERQLDYFLKIIEQKDAELEKMRDEHEVATNTMLDDGRRLGQAEALLRLALTHPKGLNARIRTFLEGGDD